MTKYFIILITIYLTSCQVERKYAFSKDQKKKIIKLLSNDKDSIPKESQYKKSKVLFAIDPECPLCQSYSHKINQLYTLYKDSIDFYGFLPSPIFSEEKTNVFIEKYNFKIPLFIDTNQVITTFLDAQITPECFLLDTNFNTIYQGLIDDWIKELGRKGQTITKEYLSEAIISYLKNDSIMIKKTNAIGCIIERFK